MYLKLIQSSPNLFKSKPSESQKPKSRDINSKIDVGIYISNLFIFYS